MPTLKTQLKNNKDKHGGEEALQAFSDQLSGAWGDLHLLLGDACATGTALHENIGMVAVGAPIMDVARQSGQLDYAGPYVPLSAVAAYEVVIALLLAAARARGRPFQCVAQGNSPEVVKNANGDTGNLRRESARWLRARP